MRVVVIEPSTRSIYESQVFCLEDMQKIVGGYICTAYRFENGDTLFVDDEGLLKDPTSADFFIVNGAMQPFAGRAFVIGETDDVGDSTPAKSTVDEIKMRIVFQK